MLGMGVHSDGLLMQRMVLRYERRIDKISSFDKKCNRALPFGEERQIDVGGDCPRVVSVELKSPSESLKSFRPEIYDGTCVGSIAIIFKETVFGTNLPTERLGLLK
ncbi:unnamed protein product [Strongylus vulgaris]|uniref:Uncharacterized protein n=1 Tax=Strongylus vulgaris TaxID=40348 RepID=A0A3P7K4W8_STRVU|nr:unnamed protein product [Strongylus vulgaris]